MAVVVRDTRRKEKLHSQLQREGGDPTRHKPDYQKPRTQGNCKAHAIRATEQIDPITD